MKTIHKILLICSSIFIVVGVVVGVYFGIKTTNGILTDDEIETKLQEDALKFYDNVKNVHDENERFYFEDDTFYFYEKIWGNDHLAYEISFELTKHFNYNFTLAFFDIPDTLVFKNLIVLNTAGTESKGPNSTLYYKCSGFELYSTYSGNKRAVFDFATKSISISSYDFSFYKLDEENDEYFYNQYIHHSSKPSSLNMCTFKLYSRNYNSILEKDVPEIKVIEKPNVKEMVEITANIEYINEKAIITYSFELTNAGIYEFQINNRKSKETFGQFKISHYFDFLVN